MRMPPMRHHLGLVLLCGSWLPLSATEVFSDSAAGLWDALQAGGCISEQIQIEGAEVLANACGDLRVSQADVDECLSISARFAMEDDHQPLFTRGARLGQVLPKIQETLFEPVRLLRGHDLRIVETRWRGRPNRRATQEEGGCHDRSQHACR